MKFDNIVEKLSKYWPFIGCAIGAGVSAVSKAELERRFKEWKEERRIAKNDD